jgi:long-chain acyl-CoA synthetase
MTVSNDYISKLCKMKKEDETGQMATLKNLIVFENTITDEEKALAAEAEISLYTMEEVIFKGREAEVKKFNEPTPDDCFAFSYTSGTTGDPKGVKLTHKMGMMAAAAVNERCGEDLKITEKDCYISYLPAAHSFEQCIFSQSVMTGCKCGFFSGNVLKLTEDIGVLKPTMFPSVPRLYNRIYGKILDGTKAATGVKGWLVNKAINAKLWHLKNGNGVTHAFYDKVVFKKMK